MKIVPVLICSCLAWVSILSSCKEKETKSSQPLLPPQYEGTVDQSVTPVSIDMEAVIDGDRQQLKLSQIASEIEYYIVGDGNFTVKQAISIPDSNAFLTFNSPRLYFRRIGKPSKRYGFKALDYKWNDDLNEHNLFYDKKTTRLYCAMSGKDQNNKGSLETFDPQIVELPPLDTMLTITRYVFPEMIENKYTINLRNDKLLGFCSDGYMLSHYEDSAGIPNSILTFNLTGETLGKFKLKEASTLSRSLTDSIPFFQTSYWNEAQDQMTFMIPFCDTIFQMRDPKTIIPLYDLRFGKYAILSDYSNEKGVKDGKTWLRTLYENNKGLFMGLYQKNGPKLCSWLGWEYGYKPTLSYQTVYMKEEGKTYNFPRNYQGFINDLDGGLPFWPDGQTDEYLYMIRTVTEMRETVERTGAQNQKELLKFLDNKRVKERDYVMIVVR